jgi:hypothetical protein
MEAEIRGHQRKVVDERVIPIKMAHGPTGIPTKNGRTLPFRVRRQWSAPAGHYVEQWYIVDPKSREVVFEAPAREVHMLGLQALTTLTDEISDNIALKAGPYLIVYALNGISGGEFEVEAVEVAAEAA